MFRLQEGTRRRFGSLLIACAVFIAGCGGGGGGDRPPPNQSGLAPGQASPDNTQTTVTVRSGTELVLNGENSDGGTFPIRSADWRQTGGPTDGIVLVERTPFTDAVQIPQYDEPTTLTFELTLTNTDGDTSITEIIANVVPVDDADQFLEFLTDEGLRTSLNYTVIVALKDGLRAETDLQFDLNEDRFANYADATAGLQPANAQATLGASVRTGMILAGADATELAGDQSINAEFNANFSYVLPQTDSDDINAQFDSNSGNEDRNRLIPDHRRDSVDQYVRFSLANFSGTCASATTGSIPAVDCLKVHALTTGGAEAGSADSVQSPNSADAASDTNRTYFVDLLGEQITDLVANTCADGHPSGTHPYYAAVDPNCERSTLSEWLVQAGFPAQRGDPGDDGRNVLYINNYDLGFARDMYVRKDDATGYVYAYVTNYPALQPATLDPGNVDRDIIATVTMEYAPPVQDAGQPPFVKFFVFIPDGNGTHQRVTHLNFDGRGEKAVPESCVPCHGGDQYDPTTDMLGHGDIKAGFIPWDLDSFLFAEVRDPTQQQLLDPLVAAGFDLNPNYIADTELTQFSLEAQQDAFREINEMVLATMNVDPDDPARYNLVRDQLHQWYPQTADTQSDCTQPVNTIECNDLADVDFDASGYIQEGWEALPEAYEVYARNCRICHSQIKNFSQLETFDQLQRNLNTVPYLFQDGVMPNSRLNMDRFWIDFRDPGSRPADVLAAALNVTATPAGAPIARISGVPVGDDLPRDTRVPLQTDEVTIAAKTTRGVRLSGASSSFADSFAWTVTGPDGAPVALADASATDIGFVPAQVDGMDLNVYDVSLTVTSGEATSTATATVEAAAPDMPMLTPTMEMVRVIADDEVRITGALITAPAANPAHLVVEDSDSAPEDIVLTVTSLPTEGMLEVRSGATIAPITLANPTFTLADVLQSGDDGLFYFSTQMDPAGVIPPPILNDDSFTLSIRDDEVEGVCNSPCIVRLDVQPEGTGPVGNSNPVDMRAVGFLDADRSRDGSSFDETAPDALNGVPWSDIAVGTASLNFFDAEPGPGTLTYTVTNLATNGGVAVGFLKRGPEPVGDPTLATDRVLLVGDTFTQQEVIDGNIYYENREIGGGDHNIGLSLTDGDDVIAVNLNIQRQLEIDSDIGWVIDTRWNSGTSCVDCHAVPPLPGAPQWTDSATGTPDGNLLCDALAARYPTNVLPDRPTTVAHSTGIVFAPDSLPHQMLQAWKDAAQAEGVFPTCP